MCNFRDYFVLKKSFELEKRKFTLYLSNQFVFPSIEQLVKTWIKLVSLDCCTFL